MPCQPTCDNQNHALLLGLPQLLPLTRCCLVCPLYSKPVAVGRSIIVCCFNLTHIWSSFPCSGPGSPTPESRQANGFTYPDKLRTGRHSRQGSGNAAAGYNSAGSGHGHADRHDGRDRNRPGEYADGRGGRYDDAGMSINVQYLHPRVCTYTCPCFHMHHIGVCINIGCIGTCMLCKMHIHLSLSAWF